MPLDEDSLQALDARGYTVIDLITPGGRQSSSFANPNTFVGVDGHTYWVKAAAQQGLVAELVAGRLAARLGAGPNTRIVRLPHEALSADGAGSHLLGIGVGSQDAPDTVNTKDMQPLLGTGAFRAESIDARSRTLVTAFRSWLGVGDPQVLVNLKDGTVSSIDHGDCFADVSALHEPVINVTPIPTVSDDVGKDEYCVRAAVRRVREITDRMIMDCVAGVPFGGPWQSPPARRLDIARWIAHRRDRIEEVMLAWLNT